MAYTKIITAHMSNDEMDVMDVWQGARRHLRNNPNVRVYTGKNSLEEALENDILLNFVLDAARQHFAEGGVVGNAPLSNQELEGFRRGGRHGDNAVAIIGPRTRAFLEITARHAGSNPITGAPEFFSLGGMFNSFKNGMSNLGNTIGQGASAVGHGIQSAWNSAKVPLAHFGAQALPAVGKWLGQQAGSRVGGMTDNPMLAAGANMLGRWGGEQIGNVAGGALDNWANSQEQQNPQANQYARMAGEQAGQMPQNIQGGMSPYQATGAAVQGMGEQMGPNPVSNGMQGAGNAMMMNQGPADVARAGYHGAGGMQPGMDAARAGYNEYTNGQSPYQAAKAAFQNLTSQQQPQQQPHAHGGNVNMYYPHMYPQPNTQQYDQGGAVQTYYNGGAVYNQSPYAPQSYNTTTNRNPYY